MFEGITSATFSGVLDTIKELIPIVIPAVVGFLAFRKGWSFLKGEIRKDSYMGLSIKLKSSFSERRKIYEKYIK